VHRAAVKALAGARLPFTSCTHLLAGRFRSTDPLVDPLDAFGGAFSFFFRSPWSDALPLYQLAAHYPTTTLDEKNHGDERQLFPYDMSNELEMKRLKLIFLLMMSLEQYPSPGR
jgi:hypothetical protein